MTEPCALEVWRRLMLQGSLLSGILAVVIAAAAPAAAQGVGGEIARFETGVRLVTLDVTVSGKDGPIAGLTRDDFILKDKGKEQRIAVFETSVPGQYENPPTLLPPGMVSNRFNSRGQEQETAAILLYDRSNIFAQDQSFIYDQLLEVLTGLNDNDRLGFYSMGAGLLMVHDYNEDAAPLKRVAQLMRDDGDPETLSPEDQALYRRLEAGLTPMQSLAQQVRANQTPRAFRMIGRHLAGVRGRKNIIWIAQEFPLTFGNQDVGRRKQDQAELDTFSEIVTSSHLTIYPVNPGGAGATASNIQNTQAGTITFLDIAKKTGGKVLRNTNDIAPGLREFIGLSGYSYTLGFYPNADTLDGKFHNLDIELRKSEKTDDADMSYAQQYLAWGPDHPSDLYIQPQVGDIVADTLESTGVGLIAMASPDPAKPGFHQLDIYVRIGDMQFEQFVDNWIGSFDVAVALVGQPGGTMETFEPSWTDQQYQQALATDLVVGKSIQTSGGSGAFRVVVQDRSTGEAGSVRVPFQSLGQNNPGQISPGQP